MGRSPEDYEKSQEPWFERLPVTGSLMPITCQGWLFLMLTAVFGLLFALPAVFLSEHGHPWSAGVLGTVAAVIGVGGYVLASRHSRKL